MKLPAALSRRRRTSVAPRMVVTDLDGTLLDASGDRVSPRNAAVLHRAEAAGVRVVFATGRPIWWLGPVIRAGFRGIAVCMNGAVVYDIATEQIVAASPLSPEVMRDFVAGLDAVGLDYALAVERLGVSIRSAWAEPAYVHPWGLGEFRDVHRADLLSEPAAKMLIRAPIDSAKLADIAEAAPGNGVCITYSSDEGLIEVAAAGVSKGAALARLAAEWGVHPSEVVAFGDMPNDLDMLEWAGVPVAMANGHPEVHKRAGEIAPHHDEDGVAAVLERWF